MKKLPTPIHISVYYCIPHMNDVQLNVIKEAIEKEVAKRAGEESHAPQHSVATCDVHDCGTTEVFDGHDPVKSATAAGWTIDRTIGNMLGIVCPDCRKKTHR